MATEGKAGEEQLVVFHLAGETYGIDIAAVHEIIRMQTITRVPRTPDFVEGVINLRGRVIPVIDLHKRFQLPGAADTQNARIMVVEVETSTVGMVVDSVSEVLRLPQSSIDPPPPVIGGIDAAYLRGVGKLEDQLVILLDVNKVLYDGEKRQLQQRYEEVAVGGEV